MNFKSLIACAGVALALSATTNTARAQDYSDWLPIQGSIGVSLDINFMDPNRGQDSTTFSGTLAYFFTNEIEGIFSLNYARQSGGGIASSDTTTLGIGANYNFRPGESQPMMFYVGPRYLNSKTKGAPSQNGFAVAAGGRYFLNKHVAPFAEVSFGEVKGGGVKTRITQFSIGLSIWLD